MEEDEQISRSEVETTIKEIYIRKEPELRAEEMEKFFHGAYESIDSIIAFHVSVGFLHHESKKRINGLDYDKKYFVTQKCAERISEHLLKMPSVNWYFERCGLLKKYFNKFSGSELKSRQYRYSEYSGVSYKSYIKGVNGNVKETFKKHFNKELP
ncbi:MAG: hypothetical protein EOO19_07410 [Chryseobacterium sp.]|nr:MAG: hypothetical protein EOO19_07410 [Chryseobacterium sp.]